MTDWRGPSRYSVDHGPPPRCTCPPTHDVFRYGVGTKEPCPAVVDRAFHLGDGYGMGC